VAAVREYINREVCQVWIIGRTCKNVTLVQPTRNANNQCGATDLDNTDWPAQICLVENTVFTRTRGTPNALRRSREVGGPHEVEEGKFGGRRLGGAHGWEGELVKCSIITITCLRIQSPFSPAAAAIVHREGQRDRPREGLCRISDGYHEAVCGSVHLDSHKGEDEFYLSA
jgi:hypothetical protein